MTEQLKKLMADFAASQHNDYNEEWWCTPLEMYTSIMSEFALFIHANGGLNAAPVVPAIVEGQHVYTFACGEYSDYRVNGLFRSDVAVTVEEHKAFTKEYTEEDRRRRMMCPHQIHTRKLATGELHQWSVLRRDTKEYAEYFEWRLNRPDVDTLFAQKYGMVEIDYTELHHGY